MDAIIKKNISMLHSDDTLKSFLPKFFLLFIKEIAFKRIDSSKFDIFFVCTVTGKFYITRGQFN